ncbi:hypothetical protein [Spirillospora sp. CA-128828]|uniref:hypothetical protein n=1 Tax=Spirillospora sp. CA-128828 TaxID=3240033 RepID=UPI003D9508A0
MTGLPALDRTPLIERLSRFAEDFPDDRAYTFMGLRRGPPLQAGYETDSCRSGEQPSRRQGDSTRAARNLLLATH